MTDIAKGVAPPHPQAASWLGSTDRRTFVLTFSLAFAFALFTSWSTLRYPWYWDDYHLIRSFSPYELARVFIGPWDVDGIETVSYRPLMVVANHCRAFAFGENLILQRVFMLASLALFTSLIVFCAWREGLNLPYTIGAVVLAVVTKANHANLMWLTDATHALSGIPVALCCLLRSYPGHRLSRVEPLLIFLLALTGLLVREDIAALFPLVVVVGSRRRWRVDRGQSKARSASSRSGVRDTLRIHGSCTAALGCSLVSYFLLRRTFVPDAVRGFHVAGMISHAQMTLAIMGTQGSKNLRVVWYLLVGAVFGAALLGAGREGGLRREMLLWLCCAALGCTPGLVQERSNLLMVPATIFACALAMAAQTVVHLCESRALAIGLLLFGIAFGWVSFEETRTALLSGHPRSTQTIQFAADFLYGEYTSRATISAERRAFGERYLRQFGIDSPASYAAVFPNVVEQAKQRVRNPEGHREPFIPANPFLLY
jgi:hypothetical protein